MIRRFSAFIMLSGLLLVTMSTAWAQVSPTTPAPAVPAAAPVSITPPASASDAIAAMTDDGTAPAKVAPQLTLLMMIQQGGFILWITLFLGFVALVMAIYLFLTLKPSREVPQQLVKRAQSQIRAGDIRGAYQMCQDRDEILAIVLRAGLKMAGHDRYVIQEAMESEGERAAMALWQRVSLINNIAMIAPLLGLLGTVWGMMMAFSSIALDPAQVKGISIANSISLAMITTAGGLVVAIPSLMVYYYLRGRVLRIVAEVEAQASEFVELITEHGRQ